jgi:dTDP-4-amino-4,6-dideoxygalactose transaminase
MTVPWCKSWKAVSRHSKVSSTAWLLPTIGNIGACPLTDRLCRTVLQLPTGLQLTPEDAAKIAAIVADACEHADEVEAILATREDER